LATARNLFVGCVAGVSALAIACVQQPAGPGGPPRETTTTTSTIPWFDPIGEWTYFDLTCWVNVAGTSYNFPQSASVNYDAPSVLHQGDTFVMTVAPGPFIVPTQAQGYTLQKMNNFVIEFPISPNATFVDAWMSDGTNLGTGGPSVSFSNGKLIYKVPGALAPGSTVQMPLAQVKLIASGEPGSTIETKMNKLSNVSNFGVGTVGTNCFPNDPNLLFGTVFII
jgi:hypothetical protein